MRRIANGPLWIGHARDARDLRCVHEAGIEAIVDLAIEEPPVSPTRELVYFRVPLLDGVGNSPTMLILATDAVGVLLYEGTPTLVACSAGMSRSPAVVAVAMAKQEYRAPSDVLAELSQLGPIDVSPGLWRELVGAVLDRDGLSNQGVS
jgi:protein-tyrosine phosphatase